MRLGKKIKILLGIVFSITILVVYFTYEIEYSPEKQNTLPILTNQPTASPNTKQKENLEIITSFPSSLDFAVPFTTQAPYANWDEYHEETCEEATALMVAEFFGGNKTEKLEPEFVEKKLLELTSYESEKFGYYKDTNNEEISLLIQDNFNLQTEIVSLIDFNQIKSILAQGNLIIIPVDGRLINNPYYTPPGPPYHVLLVKGYTENKLITNDSGTRHGKSLEYSFDTILAATGDWDHDKHEVDLENKTILVIKK